MQCKAKKRAGRAVPGSRQQRYGSGAPTSAVLPLPESLNNTDLLITMRTAAACNSNTVQQVLSSQLFVIRQGAQCMDELHLPAEGFPELVVQNTSILSCSEPDVLSEIASKQDGLSEQQQSSFIIAMTALAVDKMQIFKSLELTVSRARHQPDASLPPPPAATEDANDSHKKPAPGPSPSQAGQKDEKTLLPHDMTKECSPAQDERRLTCTRGKISIDRQDVKQGTGSTQQPNLLQSTQAALAWLYNCFQNAAGKPLTSKARARRRMHANLKPAFNHSSGFSREDTINVAFRRLQDTTGCQCLEKTDSCPAGTYDSYHDTSGCSECCQNKYGLCCASTYWGICNSLKGTSWRTTCSGAAPLSAIGNALVSTA